MLASALREMFGVQLYKNNARALLSRILSILNLDWLQHARSVRGVYEYILMKTSSNDTKVELHPKPKLRMLSELSQNYQPFFF